MLHELSREYGRLLVAIANTRLIFNTMDELESFLGNNAIHSNGMLRCFATVQKRRRVYRDLKVEVSLLTDGFIALDELMRDYERAWRFYRRHLARRRCPEEIACRLLEMCYKEGCAEAPGKSLQAIGEQMLNEEVDVHFLALFLLRAIPGFDSKAGDATDVGADFGRMLDFLASFTADTGVYDVLPVIRRARLEQHPTRLMLIHHFIAILHTYRGYSSESAISETNNTLKESRIPLEMQGYWSDPADARSFWHVEDTLDDGVYFATRYVREEGRVLTAVRYTLHLVEAEDGGLLAYFMHPLAMNHRLNHLPYADRDNAWYLGEMPSEERPAELAFERTMQSDLWPQRIRMVRADSPEAIGRYDSMVDTYVVMHPYEDSYYDFRPSIYAITQDAVYVADDRAELFYRLSRHTEHHFERIRLDDNVGILEIGPEAARRRFLAIDEQLLYIPLTPAALKRYGIERVSEIE